MARARGPKMARSIRSLARQCNRSESAVRKWIAREDWPFSLMPPWDVERVKAWSEIQLNPDPVAAYRKRARAVEAGTGEFAGAGPLAKARLQALIERALLTRQRRLIEAGKMHDVEVCVQRRLRQIHEVKSRLLDLPRSMANSLVGKSPDDIEALLTAAVQRILDDFAGDAPPPAEPPSAEGGE